MISKRHLERLAEGRFVAKLNGVKFGRKPKLSARKIRRIKELAVAYPHDFIGQMYGVSQSTVWRIVTGNAQYARAS